MYGLHANRTTYTYHRIVVVVATTVSGLFSIVIIIIAIVVDIAVDLHRRIFFR